LFFFAPPFAVDLGLAVVFPRAGAELLATVVRAFDAVDLLLEPRADVEVLDFADEPPLGVLEREDFALPDVLLFAEVERPPFAPALAF